jgi:TRAP-type C4-dicarboxylate transport system substrate-binding protein
MQTFNPIVSARVVALAIAGLIFLGITSLQAAEPTLGPGPAVKLKWVAGDTPQQRHHLLMKEWGEKIIPKRSNGRVTFDVLTVSDLGVTGTEVARLLERGSIDLSKIGAQHLSGEFPIIELADMALASSDLATAKKISEQAFPVINEFLKSKNIKLLASWSFGAQVFFCQGNMTSLGDIKGKRVRGAGATIQKWLRYAGAEPMDINFAEVYTALERGVTDCAITGIISGFTQKWHEVTDTLYILPIQWGVNFTGVNLDSWNKLPKDVRDFLEANFREMGKALWKAQGEWDEAGAVCNTGTGSCPFGKPGNMKRVNPTAGDLQQARSAYEKVSLAGWLTRCKGCGAKYNEAIAPITGVRAP